MTEHCQPLRRRMIEDMQVVSKIWEYIRSHNRQNPENRREIVADDQLRRVFGKDKVTLFEMNKHLAAHLT
jgi:upstream activation factor subunit UAF30